MVVTRLEPNSQPSSGLVGIVDKCYGHGHMYIFQLIYINYRNVSKYNSILINNVFFYLCTGVNNMYFYFIWLMMNRVKKADNRIVPLPFKRKIPGYATA